MDDRKIIALFLERSEQAIDELVLKYGPAMRAAAGNILGAPQDAEECVNDTCLSVWNSIPPNIPRHLGAYTCRVARNAALRKYHSNTAAKRNGHFDKALEELEDTLSAAATVETELDAKLLAERINAFLSKLPERDRYLFVRRYWFADPVAVIPDNTGLSAHAVSVRLFSIRNRLKKLS